MKLTLRYPTKFDLAELERCCLNEWAVDYGFVHYFDTILNHNCEKLISFLPLMSKGEGIPSDHVPCTFLFAFDDQNRIVGRTSIRHYLTPSLKTDGGHIGYAVMPESRKRGYATEILRQSLEFCKNELSVSEVLLTCDNDNIGSIKTIESNGGVLIDKIPRLSSSILKRRYKIKL